MARPIWSAEAAFEVSGEIDDWIAIDADGTVHVRSGKVELGTGVRTALAQIAAEELDVAVERVRMGMGDTGRTPDEGYTAGSNTIKVGGVTVRTACAEARAVLLERAAERLGVEPGKLTVRDGVVSVGGDESRSVSYVELLGGRSFDRKISGKAQPKRREDYRVVGTTVQRVDLPAKFTGVGSYVQDLRLPGMIHGRVVRPPVPRARPISVGTLPREIGRVVQIGAFLAVVADTEEAAIRAAGVLEVKWTEPEPPPSMEELFEHIERQPTTERETVSRGDIAAGFESAARSVEARYEQPFQSHASIGPSCAVAELRDGVMNVWCSTQGAYPLRGALADLLEVEEEKVRVIHCEGAGCYGHNGADDVAADAALLARETGKPVRVQWSRRDEFAWEPYGPAMIMKHRGGVDRNGRVCAWELKVWTTSHTSRPRKALELIAGQLIRNELPGASGMFIGGDRNAPADYDFENEHVEMQVLQRLPFRVSSLRTLGAFANSFANESFMDELAEAAGQDPVEFRLQHLSDPRSREVLSAAARAANWGEPVPPHEGRGVAFSRYENTEAYVAAVVHLRVDPEEGTIRVLKVTVAHDCGLIVNPDGLENQIEGNVLQSISRTLYEQVTWKDSEVTSVDWRSYRILRFSEVPEVEIVLINRPEELPVGAGEPATITTAPAIANAIFAATGKRLRRIPFLPSVVKEALGASG